MKVFGHGTTTGVGAAINTRASFVELASLDVDGVELDVRRSTALLLLSRRPPAEVLLADVHERHRAVHPYVSMVDEAFMRRARELGLRVNAWSVGQESADEVRALIGLGVDGLITESHQQGIHLRDAARPRDD